MGFLSRKPKPAPIQVDEEHPIVEELQRMEEAVPERSGADTWEGEDDFETEAPRAAGPVAEDDSSLGRGAILHATHGTGV